MDINFKNKKLFGSLLSVFFSIFMALTVISCVPGVGAAPDTIAPEIELTYPSPLEKTGLEFSFTGTCSDNLGVTEIVVEDISGAVTVLATGTPDGESWTIPVSLDPSCQGERTFRISAKDAAGNKGKNDSVTVTIYIDQTAPEGESWAITKATQDPDVRGTASYISSGGEVELYSLDYLKNTLNINLSDNKDIPQNEAFFVKGKINDDMSIRKVRVVIRDEDDRLVYERYLSCEEGEEGYDEELVSLYDFEFLVTQEDLYQREGNDYLKTGIHYLHLLYQAWDDHGNFEPEQDCWDKYKLEPGKEKSWLIWYPESDNPGIYQNQMITASAGASIDKLSVLIDVDIPLEIFDDDGLEEVRIALKDKSFCSPGELTKQNIEENDSFRTRIFNIDETKHEMKIERVKTDLHGTTDFPCSFKTPGMTGEMYLIIWVKDIRGNISCRIIDTVISDASPSTFEVLSQSNHSYLTITGGRNFVLRGSVSGKNPSDRLRVAYVPGTGTASQKRESGEKMLSGGEIPENGFVKNLILGIPYDDFANNVRKQDFSESYDVVELFGNTDAADQEYYLLFCLEGSSGTIYQTMQLRMNSDGPAIEIADDEGKELGNMKAFDYSTEGLVINFRSTTNNGLGIKEQKCYYLDTTKTDNPATPEDERYVEVSFVSRLISSKSYNSVRLSQNDLKDIYELGGNAQPKFIIRATDFLNNSSVAERTFVLTTLPNLTSITSTAANGTTFKAGDKIRFYANFSKNVKVSNPAETNDENKIRLKLNIGTGAYAVYDSGTGTNKLTFVYTVPEGVEVDKVEILSVSENAIDLNNQTIKSTENGNGNANLVCTKLLEGTTISIDGIVPVASGFRIYSNVAESKRNADGNLYVKTDDKLKVEIIISEKVNLNGSPVLKLRSGSETGSVIEFKFVGMTTDADDTILNFEHVITDKAPKTPEGKVWNVSASCMDSKNLSMITDVNGNPLSLGNNAPVYSGFYVMTSIPKTPGFTLEPAEPTKTEVVDGNTVKYYDSMPQIILEPEDLQSGCTYWYSIDNGVSWIEYDVDTVNHPARIPDGENHQIVTKQEDKAGNISPIVAAVPCTVRSSFPSATAFTITKPDGHYKYNSAPGALQETVDFVLTFEKEVIAPAGSATLKFVSDDVPADSSWSSIAVGKKGEAVLNPQTDTVHGEKTLTFTYTVKNTDNFKGIRVTEIVWSSLSGKTARDEIGHKPSDPDDNRARNQINEFVTQNHGTEEDPMVYGKRSELVLDSTEPRLISSTPDNYNRGSGITPAAITSGNIGTLTDVDEKTGKGSLSVTLYFDEPVYVDQGLIELQLKGQWAIPAVMTSSEFTEIYTKLGNISTTDSSGYNGADYQNMLIWTDSGLSNVHKDTWTGIASGPYRKITHGIKLNEAETSYVPDVETKFVLAYELGLYDDSVILDQHAELAINGKSWKVPASAGKTFTVANIRMALEKAGVHQRSLNVKDAQGNGSTEITLTFNGVNQGREWELIVPETAFKDAAGNYYSGMKSAEYTDSSRSNISTDSTLTIWTSGVEKPVIRVDRYSYGLGAPCAGGTINKYNGKDVLEKNAAALDAPTGTVNARIDCETPGVTYSYAWKTASQTDYSAATVSKSGSTKASWGPVYDWSGKVSANADGSKSFVEGLFGFEDSIKGSVQNFVMGTNGEYSSGKKMYAAAKCSKELFGTSLPGYEGAYQTVVYYDDNSTRNNYWMHIDGSMFPIGQASMDGFMLQDNVGTGSYSPYTKNMYRVGNTKAYCWVSYEILTDDIYFMLRQSNYSGVYPTVSFGNVTKIESLKFM